jgi:integrase
MPTRGAASGKNPNGEGTIYQRKDGRFEGAAYVTTSEGTRKRQRFYGATWEEVHRRLVEVKAQEHRGIPTPAKSYTVGAFLDEWLAHIAAPSVRATTYAKYETFVRLYLKPGLGSGRLTQLSPSDVRRFLAQQKEAGVSPARLQAIHSVLRNALEHAMREDLTVRNAARLVRVATPPRRTFEPWTAQQTIQFVTASKSDPMATAFLLCVALGLRRGEVLGLRWRDIDLEDRTLHVRQQLQRADGQLQLVEVKTQRSRRVIPLPEVCVRALRRRRSEQAADRIATGPGWPNSDFVFTTKHGTPIEPRNLARSFERILTGAGLPRIRLHDLRHMCASFLAFLRVPPRTIMEILGHSQIAVTMNVYTHVTSDEQREAMRLMDGLLGQESAADERGESG